MRRTVLCFLWMCVCAIITVHGQGSNERERRHHVVMPSEQVLLAVASQTDCPLRIESPKLLLRVKDEQRAYSFDLWNRGTKPIRGYTIAAVGSGEWSVTDPTYLLMPGQKEIDPEDDKIEIVPLSEVLRDKLKWRGRMKAVVILMIVRVEFADGTVYNDEPTYKALKDHLDDLYLRLPSEK